MPRTTKRTNSNLPTFKQTIPPGPKPTIPHTSPIPSQIKSPSMLDTMKQGFSFGVGSSIAHRMMNSIFTPTTNTTETINAKETINTTETKLTTDKMYELYNKCLEKNDKDVNCNIIIENA